MKHRATTTLLLTAALSTAPAAHADIMGSYYRTLRQAQGTYSHREYAYDDLIEQQERQHRQLLHQQSNEQHQLRHEMQRLQQELRSLRNR